MNKRAIVFVVLCLLHLRVVAQVPGSAIDVQHYTFNIDLNDSTNNIVCKAEVSLKFINSASSFTLDLVKKNSTGKGMLVNAITQNGQPLSFVQNEDKVVIKSSGATGSGHTYTLTYSGIPADGLIISKNRYGQRTFFGDNWPNRAHNWLVSVDHPADKASVDFIVTAPAHYSVVANGLKVGEAILPQNKKQTHWREEASLSTKIMVIGVADFHINHTADVNGIPVYSYVFPKDSINGIKNYAYAKQILPFFMEKIGPYAYKKLANVQSKTIFGGMENAGAIFYYEESVDDSTVESLMAHEIAHQWFGDAASEKNFYNVWLSEGFATYLTLYYLENKYGIDTLKKRLIADRTKVIAFEKERLTPVVDATEQKNFLVLLNANSYEKGGWVLHMMRRKLGDDLFWKGIMQYYAQYNGGNANTDDFRKVMEKASGKDLSVFFKQWLYTAGHPDLAISWKYNSVKKTVDLRITQRQATLYNIPLEIAIDGKIRTINLQNKNTLIGLTSPVKPQSVIVDPNVNLLAGFAVSGN